MGRVARSGARRYGWPRCGQRHKKAAGASVSGCLKASTQCRAPTQSPSTKGAAAGCHRAAQPGAQGSALGARGRGGGRGGRRPTWGVAQGPGPDATGAWWRCIAVHGGAHAGCDSASQVSQLSASSVRSLARACACCPQGGAPSCSPASWPGHLAACAPFSPPGTVCLARRRRERRNRHRQQRGIAGAGVRRAGQRTAARAVQGMRAALHAHPCCSGEPFYITACLAHDARALPAAPNPLPTTGGGARGDARQGGGPLVGH